MARSRHNPAVIVRLTHVVDPEQAHAAQEILREGFRRALTRALHEKSQKEAKPAV